MGGTPTRMVAVAALGAALFVAIAWWEKRRALKIQEEIDALG